MTNIFPASPRSWCRTAGAGSISMTNQLYIWSFDGTVIGAAFGGMPTAPLLTPEGVKFDPNKLNCWAAQTRDACHVYVNTSPANNFEDFKKRETSSGHRHRVPRNMTFAGANASSGPSSDRPGYGGTPQIHLAMERGEIEGNGASAYTTIKALNGDWIKDKKIKILAQWRCVRILSFPRAQRPRSGENDADKAALLLVLARLDFGRPFFLPAERTGGSRRGLAQGVRRHHEGSAFLAEAEKLKLDIDPLSGAQVSTLVTRVLATLRMSSNACAIFSTTRTRHDAHSLAGEPPLRCSTAPRAMSAKPLGLQPTTATSPAM